MEQVYCIETTEGAFLLKSAAKAFEHAAELQKEGLKPNMKMISLEAYNLILCDHMEDLQLQPVIKVPVSKITLKKPEEKKFKYPSAKVKKTENIVKVEKTGSKKEKILGVLRTCSQSGALIVNELCVITGLEAKNISPVICEAEKKGLIYKTGIPGKYKYYGMKSTAYKEPVKSPDDKIQCAARNNRMIDQDDCNPNFNLESCRKCSHAEEAA
jgi:hypothetical protein